MRPELNWIDERLTHCPAVFVGLSDTCSVMIWSGWNPMAHEGNSAVPNDGDNKAAVRERR
jgi:hypothetical protein